MSLKGVLIKRPFSYATLTGALCLAAAGCHSSPHPDQVTRRSVGDTTYVASPADGTEGPTRLEVLLRVKAAAVELNRIDAGAFGPNGTVWLFDAVGPAGAAIRVLDSLGAPRAVAGREGAGPGEYRPPLRIFRLADGAMLAKEMSTTRAVRFGGDGQVLATIELPPKVANGWVVTPDTIGGWFIAVSFDENTPSRVGRFAWLHFNRDGVVIDTVHPPAYMFDEATPDGIAPGRIRTVGRDGSVLTTVPGPNRLTRFAPDRSVHVFEWAGEPAAYGDQERQDMQRVEDRMNELLGKARASLPRRKQPVNRILTDGTGLVWAQLSTPGLRIPDDLLSRNQGQLTIKWREPDRWAAFADNGALRFIVDLPPEAWLLDRDGHRLLGVTTDESGEEFVVIWRIVSAPGRPPSL